MFNLGALVILALFNLLTLVHLASSTLPASRLQTRLAQGVAAFCFAVSFGSFALALAVHTPGIGITTISIAAFVNLLAVLGPTTRALGNPQSLIASGKLSGLARLYFTEQPRPAPVAAAPTVSRTRSRPIIPPVRSTRPVSRPLGEQLIARQRSEHSILHPLSALAPVQPPAAPVDNVIAVSAPHRAIAPTPLVPRRTYIVPHRPNRLPSNNGAFLVAPEPATALDIFAIPRSASGTYPALASRVHLVTTNKHNDAVLPLTYAAPDPAWRTTYGRLVALRTSAR